jgi:FkbM family methyltransferase
MYPNSPESLLPWPDGLYPLIVKAELLAEEAPNHKKKALPRAKVTLLRDNVPIAWTSYDSRQVVGPEPVPIGRPDALWRALVEPGDYVVEFDDGRTVVEREVHVQDPVGELQEVTFRDGDPLWIRPGRWDAYVVKENGYRKLPIEPGGVVFDGGAHIGTFTRDALARGASEVIAYEPEPINLSLLERNIGDRNVVVRPGILSRGTGEETLYISLAGEGGGNALHSIHRAQAKRAPLAVPAFDFQEELEAYRPSTVKLDIEGSEYDLDLRMPDFVQHVAIELELKTKYVPQAREVAALMERQGFELLTKIYYDAWASVGVWTRG